LRSIIEEISGNSFDRFFDQYVFHAHHPELKISYAWDEKTKLAKLSVKQEQKVDANVLLFHVRLPVRFTVDGQALDRSLHITKTAEDFYFRLAKAPSIVRVDPNVTLLAKLSFTPPTALLHAQLADDSDALGRLQAVELLAKRKDKTTREKLKHALQNDPFYGVRIAASRALRGISSDDAFSALIASTDQPNAKVRRQVISDIASQYKPEALAALKQSLAKEKNPAIRARIINGLTGHNDKEARKLINQALDSESFRHQLADAAVSALRKQDIPANIAKIRAALENDGEKFTTNGYASGLRALGYLARNQKKRTDIREFLIGHVNNPKRRVALASIDALGQLGDPRAIAVLEKFTGAAEDDPARKAAEQAVEKLRAGRKPVDDFKNLRRELTSLKQSNSKLIKELDNLKKRFDAAIGKKKAEKK
jgi:aminopeptidase N